ncbi:hypothetical protein [Wukongibacter baidiensis]
MMWEDMILEKVIDKDELKNALVEIFHIKSEDIEIINNIEQFLEISSDLKVVCLKSMIKNKQMRLEVYVLDDTMILDDNKYTLLQKLSKLIGCYVVISGDSINPYEAIKIKENGEIINIEVDMEIYD